VRPALVPKSLALRLLIVLSIWTIVALIATGFVIASYFQSNAERSFQNLLQAHAYNLIGAVETNDDELRAVPEFGEPRFSIPLSGWYWSVAEARKPQKPLINSASLTGENIDLPSVASVPFDDTFQRIYTHTSGDVRSLRYEVQLFLGEGTDDLYQIIVAGNRDELDSEVERISTNVWLFLALFGIGTVIVGYFAVLIGLKPLKRAQSQLGNIREGREEKLSSDYPDEIQPLAHEINALVDANKAVVERARTQVGNLAHALKTPLAVIRNERKSPNSKSWDLVADQAETMDGQIRGYLDRARISAQRGSTAARTNLTPVVTRMLRVMGKLNPNIEFSFGPKHSLAILRVEDQDLEEILGNLLENASRFAKTRVNVSVELPKVTSGERNVARIFVEDDGPGMNEEECHRAMIRGERIDESTKGTGLGLSIVHDIAMEYRGSLILDRSETFGGLRTCVSLPIVAIKSHT